MSGWIMSGGIMSWIQQYCQPKFWTWEYPGSSHAPLVRNRSDRQMDNTVRLRCNEEIPTQIFPALRLKLVKEVKLRDLSAWH